MSGERRPWRYAPTTGRPCSAVLWLTDEEALTRLERTADIRPLLGAAWLKAELAKDSAPAA